MLRETLSLAIRLVRSPAAAFDALLATKPYSAVIRLVLAALAPVTAVSLAGYLPGISRLLLVLLTPPLVFGGWLVWSAVMTVFTRLLGGGGGFLTNLLVYGYAQVPYILALPALLAVVAGLLPFDVPAFILFFLNGWSILLLYIGLARGHGFSRGRALAALLGGQMLLPLLLAFLVLAVGGR
ncbi:MAG: YIP1 family protein [Patescibacteria group bacterium]